MCLPTLGVLDDTGREINGFAERCFSSSYVENYTGVCHEVFIFGPITTHSALGLPMKRRKRSRVVISHFLKSCETVSCIV